MGRQDDAQAAPRRTGFRLGAARDSAASRWPLPLLAQRRRAGWRGRERALGRLEQSPSPTPARAAATTPARRSKSRRPRRLLSFVKPLLSVVVAMSVLYRRANPTGVGSTAALAATHRCLGDHFPLALARHAPIRRPAGKDFRTALWPVYPNSIHMVYRPEAEMGASVAATKITTRRIDPTESAASARLHRDFSALRRLFLLLAGSTASTRSQCPLFGTTLR